MAKRISISIGLVYLAQELLMRQALWVPMTLESLNRAVAESLRHDATTAAAQCHRRHREPKMLEYDASDATHG